MKDLNLFNHYKKRREFSSISYSRVILPVCALSLVLVLSVVFFITHLNTVRLNKEISEMKKTLTSADSIKKAGDYRLTRTKVEIMTNYITIVDSVESNIEKTTFINSGFLTKINSAIPQNTFLETIKMDKNSVEIVGAAKTRTEIAEYQHNLKQLGIFDDVFIGNISIMKTESNNTSNLIREYEFALKCFVKGGENHAVK